MLRDLGPNWFAPVMGTGIVANAAALLPVHVAALRWFGLGAWLLAAAMLGLLILATTVHWLRYPDRARRHIHEPATAPFYGAPPLALLTVGAGTLLVGWDTVGIGAAVRIDEILWTLGTITGLLSTIAIPYLAFTEYKLEHEDTYATWRMPVVPPMASAATGAALIAHLSGGQPRLALLLTCYAMLGISLFISLIPIPCCGNVSRSTAPEPCPSRAHPVDRPRAARTVRHPPSCSATQPRMPSRPRRKHGAWDQPGLRGCCLGVRDDLAGDRGGDHRTDRAGASPVLADLVENFRFPVGTLVTAPPYGRVLLRRHFCST